MSEKPVWAPVLLHHSAMPNWKKIEGLEIKAVPECEGGGFMVRTWQAERIVEAFNLAHRWAPVIEAVGEWKKASEAYGGREDADLMVAEEALAAAYDRCTAPDAAQEPDPDTEQHGLPTDVNEDAPDPYWWCDKCGREVGSGAVRFDETHDLCGMPVRGIQPPDEP